MSNKAYLSSWYLCLMLMLMKLMKLMCLNKQILKKMKINYMKNKILVEVVEVDVLVVVVSDAEICFLKYLYTQTDE